MLIAKPLEPNALQLFSPGCHARERAAKARNAFGAAQRRATSQAIDELCEKTGIKELEGISVPEFITARIQARAPEHIQEILIDMEDLDPREAALLQAVVEQMDIKHGE